jgi:hypothetical protein
MTLIGDLPKTLQEFHLTILNTFNLDERAWLKRLIKNADRGAIDIAKVDHFFRSSARERIKALLAIAYQLDVYQSVS